MTYVTLLVWMSAIQSFVEEDADPTTDQFKFMILWYQSLHGDWSKA